MRAFATIRFEGETLIPALLSDLFGLRPTLAYAKGEPYTLGRRGIRKVGRTGCWFLNTAGCVDESDLDAHVGFLTGMLTGGGERGDEGRIRSIVDGEAVRLLVTLFWFGRIGALAPGVDPRFASLIEGLQGEIETDFSTRSDDPGAIDGCVA